MKPNFNPKSLFDEGIKLISYCPVCQHRENKMEAKVLEETEAAHLIHLRCHKCQAAVLALIIISSGGLNSVGMITDLSANDALKFKDLDSIDIEDVLELNHLNHSGQDWLKEL
jgi:hypothetical protein